MNIFLFNPENDLALAANCATFTPPVAAAQLHNAGALLPLWLAADGDALLCRDEGAAEEARRFAEVVGVGCRTITPADFRSGADPAMRFRPWGWNRALRRSLLRVGVPPVCLPSEAQIDILRAFSSRATSVAVNRSVSSRLSIDYASGTSAPAFCRSLDEAMRAIAAHAPNGGAVVKLPWSSSGRGVFAAGALTAQQLHSVVDGAIRRQGAVMVERCLPGVLDCATLFRCSGGALHFEGYSVFRNMRFGEYGGNLLAPQSDIENVISRLVGAAALRDTTRALHAALSSVLSPVLEFYDGFLGVDMLVWRSQQGLRLAPCIEINLRTTMGVVAMGVANRLMGALSPNAHVDDPRMATRVHGAIFQPPMAMRTFRAGDAVPADAFDLSPVAGAHFRFCAVAKPTNFDFPHDI